GMHHCQSRCTLCRRSPASFSSGPSVAIIRRAAVIVHVRGPTVDTPTVPASSPRCCASMLLFDIDFADDDLSVLSAYARAQDAADAARKSQQRNTVDGEHSSATGDEFNDLEETADDEGVADGVATLESKTAA